MQLLYADKIEKIKNLVSKLNKYRDSYYNYNKSLVSDLEYDTMFDELEHLERETGYILANTPTHTVGYKPVDGLQKVTHCYPPMLSLEKTKSIPVIEKFLHDEPAVIMAKMDGLTCRLTYVDGTLVKGETRGDGFIGEDVTHNLVNCANIPFFLPKDAPKNLIVDGEVIITQDDFERLKTRLIDDNGNTYKNPRNLASGSLRLLDANKSKERCLRFVAWKYVTSDVVPLDVLFEWDSFQARLHKLKEFGFTVVPFHYIGNTSTQDYIDIIKTECKNLSYPIDGCVFTFNNIRYWDYLGNTAHHFKHSMSFKFYDELYSTKIRDIEWTMGKTGVLTPTAIFDTVSIDGTSVSKASLHNLTIMYQLNVRRNCTAQVYKANQIIPQIHDCENDGDSFFTIPSTCPICGGKTSIVKEKDSSVLLCSNVDCNGHKLGKFCSFVSKQGMDIKGLSEKTLEFLIKYNYIDSYKDLYHLNNYATVLKNQDGLGETSVNNLLTSIEKSRNCSLEKFICALNIPNVGKETAKWIAKKCDYSANIFKHLIDSDCFIHWDELEGIGEKTGRDITQFFNQNHTRIIDLMEELIFQDDTKRNKSINSNIEKSIVSGKNVCITGTFLIGSRTQIADKLINLGADVQTSVNRKTDILFAGEDCGSKLEKAQKLGIKILDETSLLSILGQDCI